MSQENVPEWMPLYVYEFLADRHVQAMDLDELGAYFKLILSQWVNGSVSADLAVIARILHRDVETTERIWRALAPCYRAHPDLDGEVIQGRIEKERSAAVARLLGNRRGGVIAARVRTQVGMPVLPNVEEGWDAEQAFDALWRAYPTKGRVQKMASMGYFCDHIRTRETFDLAIAAVKGKWAKSEKWGKGFVLSLPQWISQECWNEEPEPAGGAKPGEPVYRKWEPPKVEV